MLLADLGMGFEGSCQEVLIRRRRACCTFHGLLHWCRSAVKTGIYRAFQYPYDPDGGQALLVRLALLPQEVTDKIAVMAGVQHELMFGGKVDLHHNP